MKHDRRDLIYTAVGRDREGNDASVWTKLAASGDRWGSLRVTVLDGQKSGAVVDQSSEGGKIFDYQHTLSMLFV